MAAEFQDAVTTRIVDFLDGIGLPVRPGKISGHTILPGIRLERGVLLVEEAKLTYPGDLLHEAGHLAVLPPAMRSSREGGTGDDGGQEMAAIAWSYAAAQYIGLPPEVVFHPHGYHGASQNIIENFSPGRYSACLI